MQAGWQGLDQTGLDQTGVQADFHRRSQGAIAAFKPAQSEAIEALIRGAGPLLLVQPTGWGKSLVYFAATLVRRQAGGGPTLVISPLLALIRDQVRAARALGFAAESITGEAPDDWDRVIAALGRDEVDILLVSPERLASDAFASERLAGFLRRVALFVVDEAHCISDWGHDFRPDYRRIRRLLTARLPESVAILATTATANDRVVADVQAQLGPATRLIRGPLGRESLQLQALRLPTRALRYAWLADTLPRLPGSGIVYTLTTRDADRLAVWLQARGLAVKAYHAALEDGCGLSAADQRRRLEEALRANRLKALVATTALGLGFDKPDLAFVIHYQTPPSVIHYYQQVGRAGRALDSAYGVLLAGREDEDIVQSFIANAFPPEDEVQALLETLAGTAGGLSLPRLAALIDLPEDEVEPMLRQLAAEDPAPVIRVGDLWQSSGQPYRPDPERVKHLSRLRRREWGRMKAYLRSWGCLMRFLVRELGDHRSGKCRRCANCLGRPLLPPRPEPETVVAAQSWLSRGR